MDILQVNKFFFEKGGAERYLFSLTDALEERGHRVIHFSMSHPDNRPSPYESYFVNEKRYGDSLGFKEMISAGGSFIRSREAAGKMAQLIASHRPEIAHFHNIYHQITPSVIPVLKKAGIPIVMTLHDYKLICPKYCFFAGGVYCERCLGGKFYHAALTRCSGGSLLRSALLSLEAYWQKWTRVYDGIDLFLAPSRFIRDLFVQAGFDAGRIVHLFSFVAKNDVSRDDASKGDTGRDELLSSIPNEYVLYFGRLSEEKGLLTLLSAIRQCGEVPLVLAGEGPQLDELRRYAESNHLPVHFIGYLRKPALDHVIRRARTVIQPSEWPENAPFTVLEAAFLGVPAIVSDMGGLPEQAERLSGLVFSCGDSTALAEKIRRVWSDAEYARRLGESAAGAMKEYYSKEKHVEQLESIYRRVIQG